MAEAAADPYAVLGVPRDVSDVELRRVYRSLVKRHHPDHNGGSPESAYRFAQIQQAYALLVRGRISGQYQPPGATGPEGRAAQSQRAQPAAPAAQTVRTVPAAQTPPRDPNVEQRLREMEAQMVRAREAELQEVRERARHAAAQQRAAYEAIAAQQGKRPTQEELGYYSTDDSFAKIIDDAADELGKRVRDTDGKRQFARRLSELFGRRD